jgi:hypothetical protein
MFLKATSPVSNSSVQTFERALLSNRCSFCIRNIFPEPTIPLSPSIGIDKIAIEIPLAAGLGDPKMFLSSIKNTIVGRWATKATTNHVGTSAKLEWQFLAARWSMRLEFNPSRLVDPDGATLVTPAQTIHVIEELIKEFMFESEDALPCFVITESREIDIENWRADWMSMVRISRLDAAVDIVIDKSSFDIENYKSVAPKYAKGINITYNKKGIAETWSGVYSSKDGFPMLYDKSAQVGKKGAVNPPKAGTKRFEYRLERTALIRAHMHTLADLNRTKFEYALRQGWEYSKINSVVHRPEAWMELVTNSKLQPNVQVALIGMLTMKTTGLPISLNPEEEEFLMDCARSVGISFKMNLKKQWLKATYLDLDSQSLIEIKSPRLGRQELVH